MSEADLAIEKNRLATVIGQAIYDWCRENGIEEDLHIDCDFLHPTMYVDDGGRSHCGPVVTVMMCLGSEEDDTED